VPSPKSGGARRPCPRSPQLRKLYEIGPLQLDPEARVLTHAGAALPLGARGIAVLTALVSRANEYVQKSAILDAAWPGLVVEEANLAVQISAIRRALAVVPGGEGWIETLARRGYRFVGPVKEIAARSVAPLLANRKRTNLPESLTSFVGRERELAEIKQRLPTTRLMTLTGMGGLGKTRLAQQAAAEMLDAYRDGVWFVDLAPLGDPALVPNALAHVLQVKEAAGQPLLTALCNHLRTRETLLILDNCEHVLDGCARMTEALLRDAAQVTVMATSREALHLAGECAYPLSALPLPDPQSDAKSIARSDAVQLFIERARQHRPRLDLEAERARVIAAICVRLDGIPLALELAAARVAVLPVEQILRLLAERFRLLTSGSRELPRHQTLRAMIDWSYELLDGAEKALFARLAVFAGGWTLEAASQVCSEAPITKDDVVYVLIGLIEQSLVVAEEDGDRYRMLETVRQYAQERLEEPGIGDVVRERHRDYFLALAEETEPKLTGAEQSVWLHRLDEDHDNLRAALAWSLDQSESRDSLRLCAALQRFWMMRGHLSEGRAWCARALGKSEREAPTSDRARTLIAAGTLASWQADYPAAKLLHEESLKISRELDDRTRIASALSSLGWILSYEGDNSAARALLEECLAITRKLGNLSGIAGALNNLGNVINEQGDFGAARALYEECLAIAQELGDRRGIGIVLHNLGTVVYSQGDIQGARELLERSLAIRREVGDRPGTATSLNNLAEVTRTQGDISSARVLYQEGLTISRDVGDKRQIAYALEGFAAMAADLGNCLRAACLWGAAARLREEIGLPLPIKERSRFDERIATSRATAGGAAFDHAWQQGRALTLEQAIELALERTGEASMSNVPAPSITPGSSSA
jgi:predicted ATPase/DNA-binding winged helix-turn-helix (wHTH) protein/Tfp pilus assembly protein PilF